MLAVSDTGGGVAAAGTPQIEEIGSISFQVAPGDPDAIDSAAVWHEQVSTQMSAHAAAIGAASTQALSRWQGDAASSYAGLASQMRSAFRANEIRAGDTAATMRAIARELDQCQQEGASALRQAQQWVEQAITDHAKASNLRTELQQAQRSLTSLTTPTGNDMHTGIDPSLNDNSVQTKAAQARVEQLQRELTAATKAVHEDNLHIQRCNKRGQQAWEDAEAAVSRFVTIPIEPIPAPPMPGTPTFVTPPSKSFLDEAWGVIKDGAKDTVDGVWDGTKYVLNHPVIIDGLAIVAIVAVPGAGLGIVLADGTFDELADGYQYKSGEISSKEFLEDSVTNLVVTGTGAGIAKAMDGVTETAGKIGTGTVSKTAVGRLVGIPSTGLSAVWAAGQVKKNGYNPK